jgi:hypothetical protein
VEGKGSWILSRGAGVAVVPLRGPERWGFELSMLDRQIVVGIGQSEPLTPTDPGRSLHEGSKFVGIFFICVGERPRAAASHPRRKEGRGVSFNDMQVDMAGPDHMTALLLAGRYVFPVPRMWHRASNASSLARNSLLRW